MNKSNEEFASKLLAGNRVALGQAITLAESKTEADMLFAHELLTRVIGHTGKSVRIGITGVPGVGKSTFIDAFGTYLTTLGKKVAVLAVDPSSTKTKGSILGDKTRMKNLSRNPNAFIRPTATGTVLGGVADRTRETVLLCEAAGFDIIIIETVGVGQSETTVRTMVDFFLLLMLAGAGDELQGIKKGIIEMADALVITKADGENEVAANQAWANYQHALHLLAPASSGWQARVITASAVQHTGIAETWQLIESFLQAVHLTGYFTRNRKIQNQTWFYESIQAQLFQHLHQSEKMKTHLERYEQEIANDLCLPSAAAHQLVKDFLKALI
ncbi:MAG: methylmalonyl Co-A mutase-associated GTPase MeaB [Cytophagales bacterium]|nr:methylmalonyl Co-A mutase-associated GTPase MeaB [Cytophagales bacterium]